MALYQISEEVINGLIESGLLEEPVVRDNVEIIFIGTYRFTRHISEDDWLGPNAPKLLLEEILEEHQIEFTLIDEEGVDVKEELPRDHFDVDALEEESRHEHSVNTRLNNFGD